MCGGLREHMAKIIGSVSAVFIRTKVQPARYGRWGLCETGSDFSDALIVEAKAIDDCLVFGQTKQPRFWIAGLWPRGRGTHLQKPKSRLRHWRQRLSVFVIARCQAKRVAQGDAAQ